MGAIAALEWTQSGGHVDEVVALVAAPRSRAASSPTRDPNLLTLAALLPMIVGDRDEALRIFDLAMVDAHRRGSLFAITGMYLWRGFTLFWRGDLIDAEERARAPPSTRPRPGATGRTRCSGTPPTSSWCLTERGDLAGARKALTRAPERGGQLRRRALLVQRAAGAAGRRGPLRGRGRGRRRVRPRASPATTTPQAARWSSLRAVALDALGMKRKAIELAAEELDRARDWGAPGTVARSLRVLGTLEGAEGIERLEEAVEVVCRAPARLELAKSLAALGVTRRRAGRPDYAREPLARAHELAEVCGAERLIARSAPRCWPSAPSPRPRAARRGRADGDRAARRRAGRRGPRRARDRPGAVRHPAR